MDVRLRARGPGTWDIMVRWPGRVRYRRVGLLVQLPNWRWRACEGGDTIERAKKQKAIDDFLDTFVVGPNSSLKRNP